MEVILSASSKGGVGKSEVSKLIAYQLKRDGHDVAMMDADIDSSNLASRMEAEGRVEHTKADEIEPIDKDGIKIYSMESAFTDSSFSQSGEFMRTVIRNMIEGTDWHDPDYLIVDCPPGTKDIFDELVKVLRDNLLGAVVVGQSNSIDDIGRMIKVCNHNFVPIIGFVENMSGVWMQGSLVTSNSGREVAPFGRGNIEKLAKNVGGRYLGSIPLCNDPSNIEEAASNTVKRISIAIQEAEKPEIPSLKEGDKGFYRNVLKSLKAAIQTVNKDIDVSSIQERFGNPDNPKIIAINLTDGKGTWNVLPTTVYLKIEGGLKPVKNPDNVYGGIKISSQELKFALEGKRLIMDSPKALYEDDYIDESPYGLVDAVQMGKADVWGEDVINYLSLLDKVFEEIIDKTKLQEATSNV